MRQAVLALTVAAAVVTGVVLSGQILVPATAAAIQQPPPKPEGCEYQWTGSDWTLVDSNCPNGHCEPPNCMGSFVGQTVYVPCVSGDCCR
ncbi:MAG: hypothetical protein VKJ09_15830 [Leptolyngbya sp.]|nr:hypothetical protein [Leptolyngbya sp.]